MPLDKETAERIAQAYRDVSDRLERIEFDIAVAKITLQDITTKLVFELKKDNTGK